MSKKKAKRNSEQGTYALCITIGLIVGVGLGPLLGSVLITTVIGGIAGALTAYAFNHRKAKRKP